MPAPPPYGSSSTCPLRSGVKSRYEKRRRSSCDPSTVATGRCSVSHANACGTSVKTSSCISGGSLVGIALCDDDAAPGEVDRAHALLDHRQEQLVRELEHVVRDSGGHGLDGSEHAAVLLHHLEPDELEHVVLVLLRGRQVGALHLERRPARDRAVELHDRPPGRAAVRDHLDGFAARQEAGPRAPPALVVRRLLDEERAVDPVRAPDAADPHPHVRRLSRCAIASSRETATSRFSATNACAWGHALARVSATARSTSNGVLRNDGSPSSTTAQNAETSPSYAIPTEPAFTTRRSPNARSNWWCVCPITTVPPTSANVRRTASSGVTAVVIGVLSAGAAWQ